MNVFCKSYNREDILILPTLLALGHPTGCTPPKDIVLSGFRALHFHSFLYIFSIIELLKRAFRKSVNGGSQQKSVIYLTDLKLNFID